MSGLSTAPNSGAMYRIWGIMIKEAAPMTIQITKPEVEALINQRLQS